MRTNGIPNTPGIYCIRCIITERFYIGSALHLSARWCEHRSQLQRNLHRNPKMQNAWNKYGEDAFIFEVLELVLIPELLTAREQYWFKKLKPFGHRGFNIEQVAGSSLGRKHTPEGLEKIRVANLGRKHTPEARANMSKGQLGRIVSPITRERIGVANRGRLRPDRSIKKSPETIERHRLALIGYKHTEETKRKMSDSHRGTKRSPETREKMRLAALGHAPTRVRTFIVTSPEGIEYRVQNMAAFCREHNLRSSTLIQVARGNRKQYKGWIASYQETDVS